MSCTTELEPEATEPRNTDVFAFDISTISLHSAPLGGESRPPEAILVDVPYLDVERTWDEAPREFEPVYQRKLRVALAMRGGVSLAVWIGGAVAELDLLRRIRVRVRETDGKHYGLYIPPDGTKPDVGSDVFRRVRLYARLLDAAQYDAVELDVLAGASAGGLNAVMYACAQRAGSDVDRLLSTWVDVGGVWDLLRRPGAARVDSVLRGDDYFWIGVRRALKSFYEEPPMHPLHRSDRIIVDLSATVADGEDATERGTKEGRGHFHFVASSEQPELRENGRAIPRPDSATRDRDLARLALAARSTSAFPGAFEPALIFSKKTVGPDDPVLGDASHIDMTFAFHAHRDDWTHPFRVVDGGVLDNIPIDRAFRAIRNLASEANTSRALIYLDPDPPVQPLRTLRPLRYGRGGKDDRSSPTSMWEKRLNDRQSTFLAAIRAGTGLRGISESGADEEDAIEQYRLQLLLASGRTQSLTPFSAGAQSSYDSVLGRQAYVRYRASADPQLFSQILAGPSVWQLSTNLPTRQVWTGWTLEERTGISRRFKDGFALMADSVTMPMPDPSRAKAVLEGPQALIDGARSGLGWIRALEDLPGSLDLSAALSTPPILTHPAPRRLTDVRLTLYNILAAAVDARDECVRCTLDAVQQARAAQQSAPLVETALVDALYDTWLSSSADASTRLTDCWRQLDDSVIVLRALSRKEATPPPRNASAEARQEWREWKEQPWSRLPERDDAFGAADLAPFTAAMGVPEPIARLTYWKISADEPPAHPEHFETLHARKLRQATTTALKLRAEDLSDDVARRLFQDQTLLADDKLAGTSLAHFAGFLAKAWRQNDWWWGRMDASAGAVRFLASLIPPIDEEHLVPPEKKFPVDPEPLVELAQDAVLAQLAEETSTVPRQDGGEPPAKSPGYPRPFRVALPANAWPDKIRESFTLGADTPDDLRPAYLVAVLSRGLRVASRALSGSVGFWERILLVVFRPLLVFVPIWFNPLREALVAAVLGLMIALIGVALPNPTAPAPAAFWWGLGFIVIVLLVLARILAKGLGAWHRVDETARKLPEPHVPSETLDQITAFRRIALPQGWAYAVVTAATLAVAVWQVAHTGLSVSYWILVVSSVVLAVRAGIRFHTPNESPHALPLYLFGLIAYGVWVAVVVCIPFYADVTRTVLGTIGLDGGSLNLTAASVPWIVGSAGFLIAVLLTAKWLVLFRNLRTTFLNWITVSIVAGVAAGATTFGIAWLLSLPGMTVPLAASVLVTVAATLFVWGTFVWWLPEIRDGVSKMWRTPPFPTELRKGIGS